MASTVVERFGKRDRGDWEQLYRAHEGRVFGFAYRLTGSPHDAADLTQETFVRVLSRLDHLEVERRDLGPYLLTTTKNLFLDSVAAGKRSTPVPETPEPAEPVALDEDPEGASLLRQQREEVRRANADLPASQRMVLALREVEGQSYAEIGATIGIKENAVAQTILRARRNLRDRLRLAQVDEGSLADDCRARLPQMSAHLDGQLRGDAHAELQAHLERCPHCHRALEDMSEASRRYRMLLPPASALPAIGERVRDAIQTGGGVAGGSSASGAHVSMSATAKKLLASAAAVVAGTVGAFLLWPSEGSAVSAWERLDRSGIASDSYPAVLVDDGRAVVAWRDPDSHLQVASFDSSIDDAAHAIERARPAGNEPLWTDPALLRGRGGRLQVGFGGESQPIPSIFGQTITVRSAYMSTRERDGRWRSLTELGRSNIFEDPRFDLGAVLEDGTPVLPWVSSVGWTLSRGPGDGALSVSAPFGSELPRLGVDGQGRLWLAATDGDRLVIGRLDLRTLKRIGRVWRAPGASGSSIDPYALACGPASCRLLYEGVKRLEGTLLSWGPGERTPTIVARPAASTGVFAAAQRDDGRLYVAWYDGGRESAPRSAGVRVSLGDRRGSGGEPLRVPTRANATFMPATLVVAPQGGDLLVLANITRDDENQLHVSHVHAAD